MIHGTSLRVSVVCAVQSAAMRRRQKSGRVSTGGLLPATPGPNTAETRQLVGKMHRLVFVCSRLSENVVFTINFLFIKLCYFVIQYKMTMSLVVTD